MISSESVGLLFRAKGDTADAKKAFKDLQQSIHNDSEQIEEDITGSSESSGLGLEGLTETVDKLSTGFTAATTVVTVAAAAVVAIGAAAVVVGKQLFDLAKSTSEVADEIDKFQKITNLSTDTIQALKVAAEGVGDSLETVGESWESFSELIIEASRGNEDAIKKLERNGINAKTAISDLEGTFRKAIDTVNKAPAGFQQNAVAMDLLGESALDLLPTIRAIGGNTDAYIKKLREQGVIMDVEGIRKAKQFADAYSNLTQQLTGLGNNFATQYVPQMTEGLKTLSKFFTENKETIMIWGTIISDIFKALPSLAALTWDAMKLGLMATNDAFKAMTSGLLDFTNLLALIPGGATIFGEFWKGYKERYQNAPTTAAASAQFVPTMMDPEEQAKKDKEAADKRKAEFDKQIAEYQRFGALKITEAKQQYDKEAKLAEGNVEKQKELLEDLRTKILNIMSESNRLALADTSLSKQARENLELEYKNTVEKFNSEINDQKAELGKKQVEAEKKASEESLKLAERDASRKLAISKKVNDDLLLAAEEARRKGEINEVQFQERTGNIALRRLEKEREVNQKLSEEFEQNSEKRQAVLEKLVQLDTDIARQRVENEKNVQKAIEETTTAYDNLNAAIFRGSPGTGAPGEEGEASPTSGPAQTPGIFGGMIDSLTKFFELGKELPTLAGVFTEFAGILTTAFEGVARAVGSVVENWVLMGDTGPAMFRKIVAAALASIAAESAVRAIFELAKGFAALFFNPAEATAHFTAAALFGSISVGAAVAGRLVAGNAFKSQTSGAYGSSTSSAQNAGEGGEVYSSNRDKQIVDMSRNMSASVPQPKIIIENNSSFEIDQLLRITYENGATFRQYVRKDING